ncbi:MAG: tetratricopeptide repeat protein [Cyanobacteria bacterium P01_F01_bin.150]
MKFNFKSTSQAAYSSMRKVSYGQKVTAQIYFIFKVLLYLKKQYENGNHPKGFLLHGEKGSEFSITANDLRNHLLNSEYRNEYEKHKDTKQKYYDADKISSENIRDKLSKQFTDLEILERKNKDSKKADLHYRFRIFDKIDDSASLVLIEDFIQEKIAQKRSRKFIQARDKTESPRNIPLASTYFIGRESEIETIYTYTKNNIFIVAIYGMGGIGKTEVALQFAKKYIDYYPGGLLWIKARESDNDINYIATQIVNFSILELEFQPPKSSDIKDQVRSCWRNWCKRYPGKKLVILDDVTNFTGLVEPYLPSAMSQFQILITTRNLNIAESEKFSTVSLDVLNLDISVKLIRKILNSDDRRIENELDQIHKLCNFLGNLPLALELVSKYINRRKSLSVKKIMQRLVEASQPLKDKSLIGTSVGITKQGISAILELSWQELSPGAQLLATLLAYFSNESIYWDLVEDCLNSQEIEDLEEFRDEELINLSFLKDNGNDSYNIHSIIHMFFNLKLDICPEKGILKDSFIQVMVKNSQSFPNYPSKEEIISFSQISSHIINLVNKFGGCLGDTSTELFYITKALGSFYKSKGYYSEGINWLDKYINILNNIFKIENKDDDHIFTYIENITLGIYQIAECHEANASYKEAKDYYYQLLNLFTNQLGLSYFSEPIIETISRIGSVYKNEGDYNKAEDLFGQAFSYSQMVIVDGLIKYSNKNKNKLITIQALYNLADIYRLKGQYELAVKTFNEALERTQKGEGASSTIYIRILNQLGLIAHEKKAHEMSEEYFKAALDYIQDEKVNGHPDIATTMNNIGLLYQSTGNYQESELFHNKALEIRKKIFGESHPDIAQSLNNLASLYRDKGELDKAKLFFEIALQQYQIFFHEKPHLLLSSYHSLAEVNFMISNYDQAQNLYEVCLDIINSNTVLDPTYIKLAHINILKQLGEMSDEQESYNKAEKYYQSALENCHNLNEAQFQSHNKDKYELTYEITYLLVDLYDKQDRSDESILLMENTILSQKSKFGNNHIYVAYSINKLGLIHHQKFNYEKAEELYFQALEIYQNILVSPKEKEEKTIRMILSSFNNLGLILFQKEKYNESFELLKAALKIAVSYLGENHSDTLYIMQLLLTLEDLSGISID